MTNGLVTYFNTSTDIPKNSDNKPRAYICSKGFFWWAYFWGSLLLEELIIGELVEDDSAKSLIDSGQISCYSLCISQFGV